MGNKKWKWEEYFLDWFKDHKGKSILYRTFHDGVKKMDEVRLTSKVKKAGWAAKIGPEDLDQILRELPIPKDPKVLVGLDTSDDAGVYQLNDEVALVQTVDFFTPIVDDPFTFGQIAVANALSDVYAMGGTPLTGMKFSGLPYQDPLFICLKEILLGGLSKWRRLR